jgi:uncharacterized protein YdcH (DUF465 family)|tara:strand:+ start:275 stop:550 length:276 start_codon:yes stop_codon:yes gene_type:complete
MEEIEDEFYCGETDKVIEEVVKKINFTEEYRNLMESITEVVTDSEFTEIWERHNSLLQVTTDLEGRMTTIEIIQRVYELRSKGVRLKLLSV